MLVVEVGVFLGLGHRRIALVIPRTGLAGDLASETGFKEAFRMSWHSDAVPAIVRHSLTVESF